MWRGVNAGIWHDIGLVKLFFADALGPAEAHELLNAVTRRSEDRITTLRAIEPIATAADCSGRS
jgi:hypothetical protein